MEAAKKGRKFPSVYRQSFQEAVERGEVDQFHASRELNSDCAITIKEMLSKYYNYKTYCLDTAAAVKEVVDQFGFDRTIGVLANTIRHFDYDGRISRSNKEWARTIPSLGDGGGILIHSSPGLIDLFADRVRHDYLLTQPLKVSEIYMEAGRIMSQFQGLHEPNSPNGEQFMVRVSASFLERAKPKHMERLVSMLPFSSLKISAAEDGRNTYAIIDKSENRYQPLQKRKPSIRDQLVAAKVAQAEKPAAHQHQKNKEAR